MLSTCEFRKIGSLATILHLNLKNVKCTLVLALRLCTSHTGLRRSRGIALPFHDHGTRRGVRGQRHAPAVLYPREKPGTHCKGGWVGPRAGLDRCENCISKRKWITVCTFHNFQPIPWNSAHDIFMKCLWKAIGLVKIGAGETTLYLRIKIKFCPHFYIFSFYLKK